MSAIFSHGSRKYFFVAFANNIFFVMELFSCLHTCAMYCNEIACQIFANFVGFLDQRKTNADVSNSDGQF